jgi:hypothetical protein
LRAFLLTFAWVFGAAPASPAQTSQAARQLERRVAGLESSTIPTVCRELERKLSALTSRVETQTLSASLSASPAVSRNAGSAKALVSSQGICRC